MNGKAAAPTFVQPNNPLLHVSALLPLHEANPAPKSWVVDAAPVLETLKSVDVAAPVVEPIAKRVAGATIEPVVVELFAKRERSANGEVEPTPTLPERYERLLLVEVAWNHGPVGVFIRIFALASKAAMFEVIGAR